jgi:excisionase family DNA binding protein
MDRRDRQGLSAQAAYGEALDTFARGELVSVAEAAKRLERSTEQVRRYLREGRLQGRRVGGQWFIEVAALTGFRSALREQQNFLERVRPADEGHHDPLGSVIGIGHGGGSNVAEGKEQYRRAFWWRR